MASRHLDWFKQAEADLQHAKNASEDGDYEWSCFAAQQAAEKAIKAVFQKLGKDAWGHSLTPLIGNLKNDLEINDEIIDCCRTLDKHYIFTRYPNGFDSGAPTDYYTLEESKYAILCAEKVIRFCEEKI